MKLNLYFIYIHTYLLVPLDSHVQPFTCSCLQVPLYRNQKVKAVKDKQIICQEQNKKILPYMYVGPYNPKTILSSHK